VVAACAWTDALANSKKDRDRESVVALDTLISTIFPVVAARSQMAHTVTRLTGNRGGA
jgi:hypothetical protein